MGRERDSPEETARGLAVGETDGVKVKGAGTTGAERVLHGSLRSLAVIVGCERHVMGKCSQWLLEWTMEPPRQDAKSMRWTYARRC